MISIADLQTIAGPAKATALFDYLRHKQTGGTNNAKGNQFENYFTTYQIARLWEEDQNNTFFSAQEFCFVDDLVIRLYKKGVRHYQIKDIRNIEWKGGSHPLIDDFQYQADLYKKNKTRANLFMIVSNKKLCKKLQNSTPAQLKNIVHVDHFPAAHSINKLLASSVVFRNAIKKLCALTNPGTDKLETIAAQILGQWEISTKTNIPLGHLRGHCLTSSPHFFKGGANHISAALDALLKSINGLTFTIINGTLEWEFNNGTDKGDIPHKIGSTGFNQFENDLLHFPGGVNFQTVEHLFI